MRRIGIPFYGRWLGRHLGIGTKGGGAAAGPTAPTFVSAEVGTVNSTTVVVMFNQDITSVDYTAGVTIKKNTVSQTISSGTRQANHAVVYYVITPAVAFGDTVTWEYLKASGTIAGEVGAIAMENVTAQSVTNNVAAAGFDPSTVTGYSRDWNFADATKLYTDIGHTTLVTADGNTLGAVLDTAGSGVYLTATADTTVRPTYKTAIQNGLSVCRFDGLNDYLRNATGVTADASQTVFVVCRKNAAVDATIRTIVSFHDNAQFYSNSATSSVFHYYAAPGLEVLSGTPTNWNIVALRYNSAASLDFYFNGGAPTNKNPDDAYSTSTGFAVGATPAGSNVGDYDIGRVIIYSEALTTANLDYVFSGLGTAWNITVTATS